MGGAKFVWNAKCDEDRYLRKFARKHLSIGTYPKPDQQYSQYKDDVLSPFLKDVPSQILRNSVSNWYASYQQFFKIPERGRPKRKKHGRGMTIHLTRELFRVDNTSEGLKLFIGTQRNNIGYLAVNWHDKKWLQYGLPNSLRIKKLPSGEFTVSFCYGKEEKKNAEKSDRKEWLEYIQKNKTQDELESEIVGIDRGVKIAVATDEKDLHFKDHALSGLKRYQNRIKRQQEMFARQKQKDSKRRQKRKLKIAKLHKKVANIRENSIHHITRELVDLEDKKIYILEALLTKNQTKSAKGTKKKPGKRVKQKSGLNREILNVAWHKIETQLKYKGRRKGKVVFKINPAYTSQECANCGHTHSDNRLSQSEFKCVSCGHMDNADRNAAKVIKKRAVKLLLNSGTELSDKGVLRPKSDSGRGAKIRPDAGKPKRAQVSSRQKRKRVAA
ncbi:MAG: transposase [Halobacteriovoraceae bacterium]|nr:transposase [Halobacteriovoraceae bacterium]